MAGAPLDVVVVGNVGIDTSVFAPGRDVDLTVESNFTEDLDCIGQAGGYACRGFAQLGKRTAFIGYVGDDPLGRWVRDELTHDGIDQSALFVDPQGTCRSVNLMFRDGRRKNFYDGKSHMQLEPDLAACRSVLARARLVHFHIPNWARRLLPAARELGLTISCDLQDVVRHPDPYRQDFAEQADILFFSAVNQQDPSPLMREYLRGRPGRVVICGMGARGCALGTQAGVDFFDKIDLPDPVVDTNGAGDGLAVGFLSSHVLDGHPLRDAVLRGQITARHTCAQRASSSTLITREQLDRHFQILRGPTRS